jgi:hypothetical protein
MTRIQPKQSRLQIRHIYELESFLKDYRLSRDEICLIGSAVLADYNLRENNDIDIAVDPSKRGELSKWSTPENLEIGVEKYSWLGITDRDLIADTKYHYHSGEFKIVRPEIILSFKYRRLSDKDKKDIKLIEDRFLDANDYEWDWELFDYRYYPKPIGKRGLPKSDWANYSRIAQFEQKARKDGINEALRATIIFLRAKISGNNGQKERLQNTDHDTSLYFIVWPTVSEFFDPIVSHLESQLGVVSTEIIQIGDEKMDVFINKLYNKDRTHKLLEHKKYKIKKAGDQVLIVETNYIENSGILDFESVSDVKKYIRNQYYPYVSDDSYHNIMHGPRSLEENKLISKALDYIKKK